MSTTTTDVLVDMKSGNDFAESIRVGIMSWNMGNAEPSESWVNTVFPNGGADYDLIAFGLQESTYTVKASYPGKKVAVSSLEDSLEDEETDTWTTRNSTADEDEEEPSADGLLAVR